jgi:hypothetical protein
MLSGERLRTLALVSALLAPAGAFAEPGAEGDEEAELEIEVELGTEEDVSPVEQAQDRVVETAPPAPPASPTPLPVIDPVPDSTLERGVGAPTASPSRWENLRISGFVQPQVQWSQLSEDEVSPDGLALNQDRFVVRRARLRVDRQFTYALTSVEIEANTVFGRSISVRRAEASVFWPAANEAAPPPVMLTAGIGEIPFGFELRQGNTGERVFMERSQGSRAFFPGEPDVGARLSGALGPVRYSVALQNGVPLGDQPTVVQEVYSHQKSVVGRVGFEVEQPERLRLSGGVSALEGVGFHAGTPATKSELLWSDANQDGLVTLNELVAASGQAATPSSTFRRWAINADVGLAVQSPLGWTWLNAEATMASNLDRGYLPSDPVFTGYDLRQTALVVGVVQDVRSVGLVGFRLDLYNPNADLFDAQRGEFIPTSATVTTLSPVIGVQLPNTGRLLLQYDYVADHLGRNDAGEVVDLPNDLWTLRLQVDY